MTLFGATGLSSETNVLKYLIRFVPKSQAIFQEVLLFDPQGPKPRLGWPRHFSQHSGVLRDDND